MNHQMTLNSTLNDNGNCDAVENQNSSIIGWPYDDEEKVISMSASTDKGMSSSSSSVSETESATMDFASFHQRQARVEISVSLDHVEEYPSPSSISLLNSSTDDISTIEFSIPSLPLYRAENTNHNVSVESSPAIPSYRSRRRRMEDDYFDQTRNARRSTANHVELSFADRPLSAPTSSTHSSSTSSSSSEQRSRMWILRGRPRVILMLCAVTFVALSIHEKVEISSHDFHQQLSSSGSRREEVAFPLGPSEEMVPSNTKHDLPKFYLPKLDRSEDGGKLRKAAESFGNDASAPKNGKTSSQLRQHHVKNFAMARAGNARPIFVPDQPLPDGGFRKPMERFVFDPADQQKQFRDQQQGGFYSRGNRVFSWTSWLASVAMVGALLDTSWKEYQRCRHLQEQERRL